MIPSPMGSARALAEHLGEIKSLNVPEYEKHRQQKAEIADAVDDKGLAAGIGVIVILIPEADEKIGTEAHAFPADEHHEKIVRRHQEEHGKDEQIQVNEKAR